jgi:hypothetical protein
MSANTESPELGDLAEVYTFDTAIERWFTDKPPMPLHEYLGMTKEELLEWANHKTALLDRPRLHRFERGQDKVTLARISLAYQDNQ